MESILINSSEAEKPFNEEIKSWKFDLHIVVALLSIHISTIGITSDVGFGLYTDFVSSVIANDLCPS